MNLRKKYGIIILVDLLKKARVFMIRNVKETDIKVAFVSTNSICQGEQVSYVWQPLYNLFDIKLGEYAMAKRVKIIVADLSNVA